MVTDASFWVAIFVEGNAHYTEASECLERALELQQAFHAPALTLAEVGGAIARKTGDRQAAEMAVQYLVRSLESPSAMVRSLYHAARREWLSNACCAAPMRHMSRWPRMSACR